MAPINRFGHSGLSGAGALTGGGGGGVFTLPEIRGYRGRVNAAIPTGGIILPAAQNAPLAPVTYSLANQPSGLWFTAGTRGITGTPSSEHASRAVVLTATDSSTPAAVVTQTFEFPVVAAAAAATRDDWDNRGYGLNTIATYMLALIQSEGDVGFSNENLWLHPPSSGTETGILLDEDGNATTDYADMTFTEGGESVLVSRVLISEGSDRVTFYETSSLHFGTYVRNVLMSPTLYIRIGNRQESVPYERAFGNDAQFRRSTPDLGAFLRDIDVGTHVLLAVAAP